MNRITSIAATITLTLCVGQAHSDQSGSTNSAANSLKTVQAFNQIQDPEARALAIYAEMGKVLTHPRCMNCHPVDNSPRQGMDMQIHQPPVVRQDESGAGAPGMRCSTCHQAENVPFLTAPGSLPGHEPWHLAPLSMGWIGKSLGEICQQLKDPSRNGNRSLADIHQHMAEDGLVGWGWHPGEGREPAPGSQKVFGQLTKAWIDGGAPCPTD